MQVRKEIQESPVSAEVPALVAVARPILAALVYSLKREVANDYGGYDKVKLRQLARNRAPHDGEAGVCFEYAVHDAISNQDPGVVDRIETALKRFCGIKGDAPNSLLFGVEKTGNVNLIESIKANLTNDSRLLSGSAGRPVKLKKHIDQLANAFRKAEARKSLPTSIGGLWRADLFVGRPAPDQWVGTSVKIQRRALRAAKGLRLAVVPSEEGNRDAVSLDEMKNLIIVPVPYDGAFMEVFWCAWETVIQVCHQRAELPTTA
jgi:hypothetical protein